jgi:acetolactate synthase-1/2/3 large subunit
VKYSSLVVGWLRDLGYTHCFFVAGGNSMHLLDGARQAMTCIPVVHEVAAGIAVEYFNEAATAEGRRDRAFALVTAGPGMTNIATALAGAYLESRELLVLGGQVKSSDLSHGALRQRGIQEVDGVAIASPVTKTAVRLEAPMSRHLFTETVRVGSVDRKGPVFIEICLDAQAATLDDAAAAAPGSMEPPAQGLRSMPQPELLGQVASLLDGAERPVVLLGGGVERQCAADALQAFRDAALPVMTTWNGLDRIGSDDPVYAGRPNTWGQRSANVLVQQCDVLLALGTRLGLQQTGFNWRAFAPLATVVQVDVDPTELAKGHPRVDLPLLGDANDVLRHLAKTDLHGWPEWLAFCQDVRRLLPTVESVNHTGPGFLDPYQFVVDLSNRCRSDDVIVPCSSGGAFTVSMQAWEQQAGQVVITDKGLASMGYGLGGAIGACIATQRRTVLVEGDGGFAQNSQELATLAVNGLPVKVFLFSNEGYASIRMTQRNYFGGAYLGCDVATGLGFPDWQVLASAYGIPVLQLGIQGVDTPGFDELFDSTAPAMFVVPIDPEQTYLPKITSRITSSGTMESQPLHLMSPDLPTVLAERVLPYLTDGKVAE